MSCSDDPAGSSRSHIEVSDEVTRSTAEASAELTRYRAEVFAEVTASRNLQYGQSPDLLLDL